MHFKSLAAGFVLGLVVATAAWLAAGESIRLEMADKARSLGKQVQTVGKKLEQITY